MPKGVPVIKIPLIESGGIEVKEYKKYGENTRFVATTYSNHEVIDGDIVIYFHRKEIHIRRADIDDYKTSKFSKYKGNIKKLTFSGEEVSLGVYEIVAEDSDEDYLVFRLT